jgi:uncharacterized protein (TIGR00369 family)
LRYSHLSFDETANNMTKPNHLEAWLAEEKDVLNVIDAGVGVGVARPDQIAGKSGLELMQAMLRGELPSPSIAHTLDFVLVRAEYGHAIFQGRPGAAHMNPLGTVHGGWFATLLDSAMGCSVHTRLTPGQGYTTAEMSVNIVRALTPRVARVRAEGRVIHCGRQLATAEARLVGPDGTLYAHATTTCLVFETKPQSAP